LDRRLKTREDMMIILPLEISITRMAATNEKEKAERQKGEEGDERIENRTMGRKHIVPYGLYRAHLFVNAKLAERTGSGTVISPTCSRVLVRCSSMIVRRPAGKCLRAVALPSSMPQHSAMPMPMLFSIV
jgi:CRISPR-associated protein Cas7